MGDERFGNTLATQCVTFVAVQDGTATIIGWLLVKEEDSQRLPIWAISGYMLRMAEELPD